MEGSIHLLNFHITDAQAAITACHALKTFTNMLTNEEIAALDVLIIWFSDSTIMQNVQWGQTLPPKSIPGCVTGGQHITDAVYVAATTVGGWLSKHQVEKDEVVYNGVYVLIGRIISHFMRLCLSRPERVRGRGWYQFNQFYALIEENVNKDDA